jgi:hypothetical protein
MLGSRCSPTTEAKFALTTTFARAGFHPRSAEGVLKMDPRLALAGFIIGTIAGISGIGGSSLLAQHPRKTA